MSVYYVDSVNGDDSNDGLYKTEEVAGEGPWETIDKVINFSGFIAGDTVSFKAGDTFFISGGVGDSTTSLRAPVDGMTFNSYGSGNRPVISGNGNSAAFDMVDSYSRDDITVSGIRFQDGRTISGVIGSEAHQNGSTFAYDGDNLTLDNCVFDGASSFENCNIGNPGAGGGRLNYTITNCVFQNAQMRANLYLKGIDGVLVQNCSFLNSNGYDPVQPGYEGSGLKTNHGGSDITIKDCWFEGNTYAVRFGSGIDSEFYNNVVIGLENNTLNSALINISDPDDTTGVDGLKIYYNTLIMKPSNNKTYGFKLDGPDAINNYAGVVIQNNIIYVEAGSGTTQYYIEIHSQSVNGADLIDNNLYYSAGSVVRWADNSQGSTADFTTWQSQGYDADGDNANPLFADVPAKNFTVQVGSPAGGLAVPVSDYDTALITKDYIGVNRDAVAPTSGAYELATGQTPAISKDTTTKAHLYVEASNYISAQWYKDGSPIGGATQLTYISGDLEIGHDSVYYCKLTGSVDVIDSASVRVIKDVGSASISYQMIV